MKSELEGAVLDAPDEDAPRRVYADWLIERNDPQGEFIQVQCELAAIAGADSPPGGLDEDRRRALADRERDLLTLHEKEWTAEIRKIAEAWVFRRGFIESVTLKRISSLLDPDGALFAIAPIRGVRVSIGSIEEVRALAECPHLRRLRALHVPQARPRARSGAGAPEWRPGLGDDLLEALASSRHVSGLEELTLTSGALQIHGARALARSSSLTGLTRLDLSRNRLDADGCRVLCDSPNLARLTSLALGNNALGPHGAMHLARSPHLAGLTSLRLDATRLGVTGTKQLASSPHLVRLLTLDLGSNELGADGARVLASWAHLAGLRELHLGANALGDAGVKLLTASPYFPRLRVLALPSSAIGSAGAMVLARCGRLDRLTDLDLDHNRIGELGAKFLAESPHLGELTSLSLEGNAAIEARARKALQSSKHLARLTTWTGLRGRAR
jgi:uncharacterized protein (TIGR02996 family)